MQASLSKCVEEAPPARPNPACVMMLAGSGSLCCNGKATWIGSGLDITFFLQGNNPVPALEHMAAVAGVRTVLSCLPVLRRKRLLFHGCFIASNRSSCTLRVQSK